MRIVHIQLHRVEKVGHNARLGGPSIDQVLALPPNEHLTRHIDLLVLLIADGARGLVLVIKYNGDAGLVNPRLALLVDELG